MAQWWLVSSALVLLPGIHIAQFHCQVIANCGVILLAATQTAAGLFLFWGFQSIEPRLTPLIADWRGTPYDDIVALGVCAPWRRLVPPISSSCATSGEFDSGTSNGGSGTRIIKLAGALDFSKFVRGGAAMAYELRKVGTWGSFDDDGDVGRGDCLPIGRALGDRFWDPGQRVQFRQHVDPCRCHGCMRGVDHPQHVGGRQGTEEHGREDRTGSRARPPWGEDGGCRGAAWAGNRRT